MYTWEKFWDIWDSVVFSDGRVCGAIGLGTLLNSKKEIEIQLIVAPSVSSEACPVAPVASVEDGVRNKGGLSNVAVNKGMLVSVKSSHKAYLAQIEEERKNEDS